jgi:hypothetical protein
MNFFSRGIAIAGGLGNMQSSQTEVVGICQFRKEVLRFGALPPKALFSRNNRSIFTDSSKQIVARNFNQQKQYTSGTHSQII